MTKKRPWRPFYQNILKIFCQTTGGKIVQYYKTVIHWTAKLRKKPYICALSACFVSILQIFALCFASESQEHEIGYFLKIPKVIQGRVMDKIIVYTCITGSYDTLMQPFQAPEDFEFICFVQKGAKKQDYSGVWKIEEIPFEWEDMTLLARSQKLNPHTCLPEESRWSLWLDRKSTRLNSSHTS